MSLGVINLPRHCKQVSLISSEETMTFLTRRNSSAHLDFSTSLKREQSPVLDFDDGMKMAWEQSITE